MLSKFRWKYLSKAWEGESVQSRTENVAYHFFHPSDWGSKLSSSSVTTNEILENCLVNCFVTLCGEWPHTCHRMGFFFFQGVVKRLCYNLARNLEQQNLYKKHLMFR